MTLDNRCINCLLTYEVCGCDLRCGICGVIIAPEDAVKHALKHPDATRAGMVYDNNNDHPVDVLWSPAARLVRR